MTTTKMPIICVIGPTASGKTALAVELVQQFPAEIISVDSAMIYRGLNIGTAKPDSEILEQAPHRLIDIRDPAEVYSVGDFCSDVLAEIEAIQQKGKIPLLVGGTMLYFHALQQGLGELPGRDETIRKEILAEAEQIGWPGLHEQLADLDPAAALRIHAHDSQRIQRALEVYRLTGKSITQMRKQGQEILPYAIHSIVLAPEDRSLLHARIATRFQQMLDLGFVDEVKALRRRGDLSLEKPALRAVGYRQVWEYLEGKLGYAEMQERAVIATRQLAKRQLTWMRRLEGERFACEDGNLMEKTLRSLHSII